MNIKEFIRKKIANPLCELFPEKIKNKIHLVGTVLFGDDWNYYYVHPCPGFAQITHHDVEKIYSDLSESSLKVLLDYVDYQHGMKQLNRIVDLTKYTIIIPSAQSYPYVRDKVEQEKKACREAKKKSGFSNCTPEVFCYHHGLTLVPNEIKDYIKDSCFIDAGAYTGDSTYVFAQYQPSKILSFEPSTKNGKIFKRNMIKSKINCAQLIQAGISDTAGEFFYR